MLPPMKKASPLIVAQEELALAPQDRSHGCAGRIGVLLVNLGTPDAPNAAAVRRYLREFLSDHRVIENWGQLWKFISNCIIFLCGRGARRTITPEFGIGRKTNRRSRRSR